MSDKERSLADLAKLVESGQTLALGGMTLYRRPMAFVRALLARPDRPDNLTLLSFTGSIETDLLIGAGIVSTLRSCYCGLEVFGLAPMFTDAAGQGAISIIEETEASLSFGIRATLAGVSFMPGIAWLGTDILKHRPHLKVIDAPYHPGQQVVAFPAIQWDVAVIHALQADPSGNAVLNPNMAVDVELAIGGKLVIVTAEEFVPRLRDGVQISGAVVDYIAHAPQGAWPSSCYPYYPLAGGEILRYIDACNAGEFERYLAELSTIEAQQSDGNHST
ncbi:MAG: CoA transferase subunit A [Chloroflexi bacterium]|nr:CoA transferase subunit A [Chloroflexota bacterium]